MRQIKDWVNRLSIRAKLIFYSYLIITPILLLISVLLFVHNYQMAISEEENTCIQNVQGLSDSVEAMQKNVMELGTYITINTDISKLLTADNVEELNADGQVWLHNAPMQMLQDMMAINGTLKTLAIYPENGVAPYLRCMDATSHVPNIEAIRESELYEQAVANGGKVIWRRVGKRSSEIFSSNRTEKIVLYREIYDLSKQEKLGFLAIGSSAERFDTICSNGLRNDREEIIVMSDDGAQLVRCGGLDDDTINDIMQWNITEEDSTETVDSSRNLQYALYQCQNEDTGVTVYKIVPQMGMKDVLESILVTPLALLGGFLIGLYPIIILVSNIISKPLKRITQAMRKFKKGDFSQQVDVLTGDEVGEASACFNEMVEDMKLLIDTNYVMALKEKESELDALQAQINPHFLYNALDSLYWQTMEAGNEGIADDILALSDLFRLVLNRGEGIVPVRNEQELLERYLQIQKMRFGKRLSYRITMEEDILEEMIPKLILQPFVENAIVHGFEKGGDDYYLSVVGKKEENNMYFYIEDTGVGMSEKQVEDIWKQEDTRQYAGQRIGKYAIKNVKERLELKYQNNFELRVESEVGQGTMVIIRIPCQRGKED